ncbi:cyclophilin-like fold protein [uncultured Veillonella sp.]|uniref:cyclophilin-like fold protein n=1 Tax=uncultured Veillonella sp. TaxID=159268 RepID=UPI0026255672|nr:cyclophilin-like fold protein [uncultured Veillonella sp.]
MFFRKQPLFIYIACLFLILGLSGCSTTKSNAESEQMSQVRTVQAGDETKGVAVSQDGAENESSKSFKEERIHITINGQLYILQLARTEAAAAFKANLPRTLTMKDVNSNEKYAEISESLPTQANVAGHIVPGQVKLWGKNGIVIFYKEFDSSYSYRV